MFEGKHIALILPARNEVETLPQVLDAVPSAVDTVIVVDNGSKDETAKIAADNGAYVISEPKAGYGRACLAGIKALTANPPDIVTFADADGSDNLSGLCELLSPLAEGSSDLVIEKRLPVNSSALTFQQRFGNSLAVFLIYFFWNFRYSDLGPMRAIRWQSLLDIKMDDKNFGWTVEMQIRALKHNLRVKEVPLPYHARAGGSSKVSRTVKGTLKAGFKILWVVFREAFTGTRLEKIKHSAA